MSPSTETGCLKWKKAQQSCSDLNSWKQWWWEQQRLLRKSSQQGSFTWTLTWKKGQCTTNSTTLLTEFRGQTIPWKSSGRIILSGANTFNMASSLTEAQTQSMSNLDQSLNSQLLTPSWLNREKERESSTKMHKVQRSPSLKTSNTTYATDPDFYHKLSEDKHNFIESFEYGYDKLTKPIGRIGTTKNKTLFQLNGCFRKTAFAHIPKEINVTTQQLAFRQNVPTNRTCRSKTTMQQTKRTGVHHNHPKSWSTIWIGWHFCCLSFPYH